MSLGLVLDRLKGFLNITDLAATANSNIDAIVETMKILQKKFPESERPPIDPLKATSAKTFITDYYEKLQEFNAGFINLDPENKQTIYQGLQTEMDTDDAFTEADRQNNKLLFSPPTDEQPPPPLETGQLSPEREAVARAKAAREAGNEPDPADLDAEYADLQRRLNDLRSGGRSPIVIGLSKSTNKQNKQNNQNKQTKTKKKK